MKPVCSAPSFYIHILTWIFIFISVGLIAKDFSNIQSRNTYDIVLLLLVFTQVLAIHGITHLGLENVYKYNPLNFLFKKEEKKLKDEQKN